MLFIFEIRHTPLRHAMHCHYALLYAMMRLFVITPRDACFTPLCCWCRCADIWLPPCLLMILAAAIRWLITLPDYFLFYFIIVHLIISLRCWCHALFDIIFHYYLHWYAIIDDASHYINIFSLMMIMPPLLHYYCHISLIRHYLLLSLRHW